jgi:hypothetical protein
MKYLLKNFIVFILTCCMTTCVCCANPGTEKAIEKRDAFKITVKDHKGVPVSGLELKFKYSKTIAKTDGDGLAMFKDQCKPLLQQADKDERGKIGLYVLLTDPYKRYKPWTGSLWIHRNSSCDRNIQLDEADMNKPYKKRIQANEMRKSLGGMAVDGAGNLLFYSVCLQNPKLPENPKLPAKVTGKCVDIFKGVNTQQEPAVALAQAYVDEKVGPGHKIECQTTYTTYNNDDYLACTSSNYNSHVFEFQFDDLTESVDATIRRETLEGLCTLYGGEILPQEGPVTIRCSGSKTIGTKELCSKLNSVAKKFASAATYEKDRSKATSNSYCYVESRMKPAGEALKTYPGLDSTFFQSYQTKFDSSTKVLIGQYVESVLKDNFSSLKCASMTKSWQRGLGVDDVVECTLRVKSNKTESYKIEFVFDDLSELINITSQGDKSKMTCLTNDGTYVAGRCVGVSEAQCTKLGQEAHVKVNFNSALKICELPDAKTQEGWDKALRIVESIGWATLAVWGVIGSGGAAIPALVAFGAGATVANSAIAVGGEVNESVANNYADEILGLIAKCKCDAECANGICKACESCVDCDVNEIYSRLPYAITFAHQDFVPELETKVASIKSCVKPDQLDDLKRKYNESLGEMRSWQSNVDTASNVTAWLSLVTPGGGKKAFVNKVSRTTTAENLVDVVGRVDTVEGIIQSDSTSTTQPPNQ